MKSEKSKVKNKIRSLFGASFLLLIFCFFSFSFFFFPKFVNSQNPPLEPDVEAFPDPIVPCTPEPIGYRPVEFHSMRPYQASPCGDAPNVFFCNNDYIIEEDVSSPWDPSICDEGSFVCDIEDFIIDEEDGGRNYYIELHEADFPILGNTQNVANSQGGTDEFDAGQKMSEYVNWYLQGVPEIAEEAGDTLENFVSFAGPTKKLLPLDFLNFLRLNVLHDGTVRENFEYSDPLDYSGAMPIDPVSGIVRESKNHNQVVVCTEGETPVPCWSGGKNRLIKWWNSRGSVPSDMWWSEAFTNWDGSRAWTKATPPFPWLFRKQIFYQKAFNEWLGQICTLVGEKLSCTDSLFGQGELKKLYNFIPLGNATDKVSKHFVSGVGVKTQGQTEAEILFYNIVKMPKLFVANSEALVQVSTVLNMVHTPVLCDEEGNCDFLKGNGSNYEPRSCEFVDVRTNPGDDLTFSGPDNIKTYVQVDPVITEVRQIECSNKGEIETWLTECDGRSHSPCQTVSCNPSACGGCGSLPAICAGTPSCQATVHIEIRSTPNIPHADKIWKNTVVGKTSPFRRIFPKLEEGAPVQCIKEIPGVTKVNYQTNDETNLVRIDGPGSETDHSFPGAGANAISTGELYFPHQGTILEYFLHGIQTALRPLGFGEPLATGEDCVSCNGELPELKTGSCSVGSMSARVPALPQTLLSIVDSAAEDLQVPGDLIIAVLYGEGVFNGSQFRGEAWSDANATSWATCEPLPNCTDSESGLIYLGEDDWNDLAGDIEPYIKDLYPDGLPEGRLDPCNLVDAIYAVAQFLDRYQTGSPSYPEGAQCLGVELNKGNNGKLTCDWDDEQYMSAIRFWEFGACYGVGCNNPLEPDGLLTCATKDNSCAEGGGFAAQCDSDTATEWDTCKVDNNSHTQCLWDIAHDK